MDTAELAYNCNKWSRSAKNMVMKHKLAFGIGIVLFVGLIFVFSHVGASNSKSIDLNNPVRTAQEDEISSLPNMNYTFNFKHYSGYLEADDEKPTNRFWHYWFVESQSNPTNDPLVLWLNGGPGCSSVMSLLNELGPFKMSEDGNLIENPFTWNRKANVIFMESPAGVGYSYAVDGDITSNDDTTAQQNYKALQSFLRKFPQYKNNPLYLAGESYGGVYVPTLGVLVEKDADFNFKGITIGNPFLDFYKLAESLALFSYYHGLIGPTLWNDISANCCGGKPPARGQCNFFGPNSSNECAKLVSILQSNILKSELNPFNLYDRCIKGENFKIISSPGDNQLSRLFSSATNDNKLQQNEITNIANSEFSSCYATKTNAKITEYLNQKEVKQALNIPNDLKQPFKICNYDIKYTKIYPMMEDGLASQIKKLLQSQKELDILIYNGDVDLVCNVMGNQWFVQDLKQDIIQDQKPWFFDDQIAGYEQKYRKITFTTVKGAGHMVPYDKPAEAQLMFESFLSRQQSS